MHFCKSLSYLYSTGSVDTAGYLGFDLGTLGVKIGGIRVEFDRLMYQLLEVTMRHDRSLRSGTHRFGSLFYSSYLTLPALTSGYTSKRR